MVFARPPAPFRGRPGRGRRDAAASGLRAPALPRRARALVVATCRAASRRPLPLHRPLFTDGRGRATLGARVLIHDHLSLSRGNPLRAGYKRARSSLLNRLFDERLAVSPFVARTVREPTTYPPRGSPWWRTQSTSPIRGVDGRRIREELRLGDAPLVVCVAASTTRRAGVAVARASPGRPGRAPRARREVALGLARALRDARDRLARHFLGLRQDVEEILAAASVVVAPRCTRRPSGSHCSKDGCGEAGGGDGFRRHAGDRQGRRAGRSQAGCAGAGRGDRWPPPERRARAQSSAKLDACARAPSTGWTATSSR